MPANRNPLDLAKSTETKVVRRVAPSETQCYIAKAYKIPQNYGCDSPFFGSTLTELVRETGRVQAFTRVMISALPVEVRNIVILIFFPNDGVWQHP